MWFSTRTLGFHDANYGCITDQLQHGDGRSKEYDTL